MNRSILLLALAAGLLIPLFAQTPPLPPAVRVPFVGCKSDGQTGPLDAPGGGTPALALRSEEAARLAYYKAESGPGVLAPRGWHCFGTYGSNGEVLYVSPQPLTSATVFSNSWHGFAGPAVQLTVRSGETSGRFDVARIAARLFPAYRKFVDSVIAENLEPASAFPNGSYPKDRLTYKGEDAVEYHTPPQTDGLGTRSFLLKNARPINGVAVLTGGLPAPDLVFLAMRLPPELTDLVPIIIQQVEREAAIGE